MVRADAQRRRAAAGFRPTRTSIRPPVRTDINEDRANWLSDWTWIRPARISEHRQPDTTSRMYAVDPRGRPGFEFDINEGSVCDRLEVPEPTRIPLRSLAENTDGPRDS